MKLQNHSATLMKLHDELADLKSHFDGHGDFDAKPLDSIACPEQHIVKQSSPPVSDQEGAAAEEVHAAGRNFVPRLNVSPAIESCA